MPPENSRTERSEEHTSELQSPCNLVCRLLLEKKKNFGSRRRASPKSSTLTTPVLVRKRLPDAVGAPVNFGSRRRASPKSSTLTSFFLVGTRFTEFYTLSLHDALPI